MINKPLIIASIVALSAINAPKINAQKITNNKAIVENFDDSQKKIDINSLNHEKIITTLPEDIFKEYGKEVGLKIIQEHTLQEINKIRVQYNLKGLKLDDYLSLNGQYFAKYMSHYNHFSHKTKEGVEISDLINRDGIQYSIVKSNLGYGMLTIKDFIKNQMGSKPHKANITEKNYERGQDAFRYFGLGYKGGYRIIIFANKYD